MNPAEFIKKWRTVELRERQFSHSHFNDVCALLGHGTPVELDPIGEWFCFDYGAQKADKSDGFADAWKKGYFGWEYKGAHKDLDDAYAQLVSYSSALESPPLLVVCDPERFLIHTNFTNTKHVVHDIPLTDLVLPERLAVLRAVFHEPEKLRPGRVSELITADAARSLGYLAQDLRERGCDPHLVARFLDRIIFAMFAEDIALLPQGLVSDLLETSRREPERFKRIADGLFAAMATGGEFGAHAIRHFNGNLYDNAEAIALERKEIDVLFRAARLDWTAIDPSIFGTLFERGLDPSKRSQIGAHYTSREDIETLVEPVVMVPLRRDWTATRAMADQLLKTGKKDPRAPVPPKPLSGALLTKARNEAKLLVEGFLDRLEAVTILDPACGSGNFLYVALQRLLDLEHEVRRFAIDHNFPTLLRLGVGPWQLYGIEINDYAAELAQMTVWIGYLQWLHNHGTGKWKEPILKAMSNIECRDAILDLSKPTNPREPEWPKVDFVVGNPPFLGGKMLRRGLGDSYVDRLLALYDGRVSAESDLCCYWFELACAALAQKRARRVGLLATQAIRGGANREALRKIKLEGDIFFAVSDREWILDGANVHVSLVGFDDGSEEERILDGCRVKDIAPSLSSTAIAVAATSLRENLGISFMGITPAGPFDVNDSQATAWLASPNPHGLPNSDVLRPYFNGADVARRSRRQWTLDFFGLSEAKAAQYEGPFEHLRQLVFPVRGKNPRQTNMRWWEYERPRVEMREAFGSRPRYLATSMVAKHRIYSWLDDYSLPANVVIVFARSDDYFFGVLHSRAHELWALAQGTQLREKESGFRYTPTTCFETFPLPHPTSEQEGAIASASRELDDLRKTWLNPPEWTKEETLEFPGSINGPWRRCVHAPDARGIGTVRYTRSVARDEESAKLLAKRTLTNLYNQRPAWLQNAHRKLDEAVFAAYGWDAGIAEEEVLNRLLALNLERSAEG